MVQKIEEGPEPEERQKAYNMFDSAEFDGQKDFDEFTQRHSEMRYDEDTIITEQNERQKKFDDWKSQVG